MRGTFGILQFGASPDGRAGVRRAGAALAAAGVLAACGGESDRTVQELPYAREYPAVGYAAGRPDGRLGQLAGRIADGDETLRWRSERGYLDAVLAALEIDASSQVLVYSRTSLQTGSIRPSTPRAVYFNDDTYVAWIPEGRTLELAGYDADLGPVFYTILQDQAAAPAMERQLRTCLRCHDTYSLSGGGVPRFLLGSGYTGTEGELVSHEAWILTSQSTPLRNRWGGWYVTGSHGDAVHLGNIVVEQAEDLQNLESLRVGNIQKLSGLFDTSRYLAATSDIVALMVLEHQVEVQNLISRLRFEAAGMAGGDDGERLEPHVEALVGAMLMADEADLTSPISGSSGFAEHFESLGPFDAAGRSLRELDLKTRLFRYPLSYLIYSNAFAGLPDEAAKAVYQRLRDVLEAPPGDDAYGHLLQRDREAIAAILRETLPAVLAR